MSGRADSDRRRWATAAAALLLHGAAGGAAAAPAGVAILPGGASAGGAQSVDRVAMFGGDQRRPLGQRSHLRRFVGALHQRGTGALCSAFCLATDVIATAGHCVQQALRDGPHAIADLRFAPAARPAAFAMVAGAREGSGAASVMTGAAELSTRPPINAVADWALLRLDREACTAGGLAISTLRPAQIATRSRERRIYQVAYHRDLARWEPAIAHPCRVVGDLTEPLRRLLAQDFTDPARLLLHDCDTGAASSGSPLLTDGARGAEVIGINVGTYVRSQVVTHDGEVVQRLSSEKIANTAVAAAALAGRLAAFLAAEPITDRAGLALMQSRLRSLGFGDGLANGAYDMTMRSAILAYERSIGVTETGLPLRTTLERLTGEAGGRHAPPVQGR